MVGALLFVCAFALLIGASSASAAGPTYVYQDISTDTAWDDSGSPYIVNNTITVQSGVTLTVGPNVTVKADPGTTIFVDGSLVAAGNAAHMVNFTQNSTTWSGIYGHGNSVISFNFVKFNNATGLNVQNTGVFINSRFTDISTSAINFNIASKNGNLTVTNCEFTQIGTMDILGLITVQSNANNVVTYTTPISITNNYFGPGSSNYAIQISEYVYSSENASVTLNGNVVINNNRFNIGAGSAISLSHLASASQNSTATFSGFTTINLNRFNSGNAISITDVGSVADMANPTIKHYNAVHVNDVINILNNDLRQVSGYGFLNVAQLVAFGQTTSSINDPVTITGNNFTTTGDAIVIQKIGTAGDNATGTFSSKILVENNRMLDVVNGANIYRVLNTVGGYNSTITYTGNQKISNNTVTIGSGPFLNQVLSTTSVGYGQLNVNGGTVISDNNIVDIGSSPAFLSTIAVVLIQHSETTITDPTAIINNNVDRAGRISAYDATYTVTDWSKLTIQGDILVQGNEGAQLANSGVVFSPTFVAENDATLVLTSNLKVLDNKINSTLGTGIELTLSENAVLKGSSSLIMPIEISRNTIRADASDGVAMTIVVNAANNATAGISGAIFIDSNRIVKATNAFMINRQLSANNMYNSSVSLEGNVVCANNVMTALTGKGLYVYDRVSVNGYKTSVFTSSVIATGNTVDQAFGRMIDIDRDGMSSYGNARLTISGVITVDDNVAAICGDLINVNLGYNANGKSTVVVTGDVLVRNNQGLDVATSGIQVYSHSEATNNAVISTTSNIEIRNNFAQVVNSHGIDMERDLVVRGNSTGTFTGTVKILRNTLVQENFRAFYAENYVASYDNAKGLIIGDFTVSNNTVSVYDQVGFDIEIMASAEVRLAEMVSTATYNGNVLIADNMVTVTDCTGSYDQYYIYFWAEGDADVTGSTQGNKWANATMGNIQVLRNTAVMNGEDAYGIEYDPDIYANAAYGGSASAIVGTQMIANNQVTGFGDSFYGLYIYGDNLYADSNVGNATVVSGAITFRDNTIDLKGNGSTGIYFDHEHDIYAQAQSRWLASFILNGGLNIVRNTIVMNGNNNYGIDVYNDGYQTYVQVDDSHSIAVLEFDLNINNNVLTMLGMNNYGILVEDYYLYAYYWNGNVTLKAGVSVASNNVRLNGQTGAGILVNVPLEVDSTSFNGQAALSTTVSVMNNIVAKGDFGIRIIGSGEGIIFVTGNKVTGTNTTALVVEHSNAVIENNIITENQGDGIRLANNLASTNIAIGNNTITHNVGYGLRILTSNGVTMYNGIFETNMKDGISVPAFDAGYTLGSQVKWVVDAAASVRDNDVLLGGNLEIMRTGVLTIDSVNGFTIAEADTGVTMLIVDFGGSMIVRNSNMYSDNDRGLFLVYGGLEMTSSSAMGWSEIYLAKTSTAKITACTISNNDRNGIRVDGSSPTISSTTIAMNGMDGIYIDNGSEPIIKSCHIVLNERGIYARNSNLDNVVDNIFALNTVAGVYAEGVAGRIHANIFLMDRNEIFVYNCNVSIEDNEIGYARIVDQVAQYSTVLSLVLSYMDTSSVTEGLESEGLGASMYSSLLSELTSMLLNHVGVYAVNSEVAAKDNSYGMLTYAMYAENSTVSFSDAVKNNVIVLQWLNKNLDSRNISIPTFVYNGIYAIDSRLTITGASIQCVNDAVFLDDSSAVISDSALNASRFDVYSVHKSNVSMTTTTLDGKLKVEDSGTMTWLNQFTVIVKDADGKLVSGAPVTVVDGNGKLIASGVTGSNGQFLADVAGWTQDANGKQSVTAPYWVNATVGGKTISQTVDGSQVQTVSAQAEKSMIDTILLPLLLIICLVVVLVVVMVVLRIRKK